MYWACAGLKICCQQRQAMQCPLFTERHAHHSSVWTIPGFSMPQLCLACATERLEDRSGVPLHCRRVLSEFQALLTTNCNSLVCAFSSDKRVLDHFSSVVFGMISIQYLSYMCLHVHVPPEAAHFFLGKVTALGVLCCFALFICLTLLVSFFLPSHLSLKTCI